MATSKKSSSKVARDYAQMSDGTRYATKSKTGGWVRLSMKRHEEKDANGRVGVNPNGTPFANNGARRRISRMK